MATEENNQPSIIQEYQMLLAEVRDHNERLMLENNLLRKSSEEQKVMNGNLRYELDNTYQQISILKQKIIVYKANGKTSLLDWSGNTNVSNN